MRRAPQPGRRSSGPGDPAGVSRLLDEAGACYEAGRLDEATRLYARAGRAAPGDFRATYSLAVIDLARGAPEAAALRLRRVTARQPALFEAWHNLGAACQSLGRWAEAAAALERAVALRPDAGDSRRQLAAALTILGRIDEAAAHYRRLTDAPEVRLWALTRVAMLRPGEVSEAEIAEMAGGAEDAATDAETRIGLCFALGEALERRGRDEAAFAAFAAGNALKRAALGEAPARALAAHAEAVERTLRRFTPQFLAAVRPAQSPAAARPIFIVGMPRSGSTLIEQILASHPRAQALGETGALPALLEAGAMVDGDGTPRDLARAYLKALRRLGWREVARPVDKTLENYLHVGAIALLFPRAVILHAVRDPVDTCLSCWRQIFAQGAETLYDLADIGRGYVAYRKVMAHWARVLPGRVIDVDHEALVADPEARIRWLVTEACGLTWDAACLRPHEAAGPVRTGSAAQVREPINAASVQRWRRYERRLGPLFEALGPYAPDAIEGAGLQRARLARTPGPS